MWTRVDRGAVDRGQIRDRSSGCGLGLSVVDWELFLGFGFGFGVWRKEKGDRRCNFFLCFVCSREGGIFVVVWGDEMDRG